jgi:hypothetical protein
MVTPAFVFYAQRVRMSWTLYFSLYIYFSDLRWVYKPSFQIFYLALFLRFRQIFWDLGA